MSEQEMCPHCGCPDFQQEDLRFTDGTDSHVRRCGECGELWNTSPAPSKSAEECERLRDGLKTASNILDDCGRRLAELGDKSAAHIAREHGDDARALLNDDQAVSGGE